MKFPSKRAVTDRLRELQQELIDLDGLGEYGEIEVRLQVYPNGNWAIRYGDPGFDTDHHGYWGAGFLAAAERVSDLAITARELIEEAKDDYEEVQGIERRQIARSRELKHLAEQFKKRRRRKL